MQKKRIIVLYTTDPAKVNIKNVNKAKSWSKWLLVKVIMDIYVEELFFDPLDHLWVFVCWFSELVPFLQITNQPYAHIGKQNYIFSYNYVVPFPCQKKSKYSRSEEKKSNWRNKIHVGSCGHKNTKIVLYYWSGYKNPVCNISLAKSPINYLTRSYINCCDTRGVLHFLGKYQIVWNRECLM